MFKIIQLVARKVSVHMFHTFFTSSFLPVVHAFLTCHFLTLCINFPIGDSDVSHITSAHHALPDFYFGWLQFLLVSEAFCPWFCFQQVKYMLNWIQLRWLNQPLQDISIMLYKKSWYCSWNLLLVIFHLHSDTTDFPESGQLSFSQQLLVNTWKPNQLAAIHIHCIRWGGTVCYLIVVPYLPCSVVRQTL